MRPAAQTGKEMDFIKDQDNDVVSVKDGMYLLKELDSAHDDLVGPCLVSEEDYNQLVRLSSTLLADHGGSHDMEHAMRVCRNANKIMSQQYKSAFDQSQTLREYWLVLTACCLLHDAIDSKYIGKGSERYAAVVQMLRDGLHPIGLTTSQVDGAISVCENMSYSNSTAKSTEELAPFGLVRDILRDADRLDAMGAVGIGRCFMYSGESGGSLEEARRHFDIKLVKLYATLVTPAAREVGQRLHDRLIAFMKEFDDECGF